MHQTDAKCVQCSTELDTALEVHIGKEWIAIGRSAT